MEMSGTLTPISPSGQPGIDDELDDTGEQALLGRSCKNFLICIFEFLGSP